MDRRDVLVAEGLSRTFVDGGAEVHAVRSASLRMLEGEVVAVMGRSGSGKTTVLSLCGGLDRPDAGRVRVDGHDLSRLADAERAEFLRRTVGWVFQTAGLLPLFTAAENVALAVRMLGVSPEEAGRQALAALAGVGLGARAAHRAHELSGGEQHRVALARALVKAPVLILADEPTSQLDSDTARDVLGLIRQAADSGTAVLIASHDSAVTGIADRVLTMDDGLLGQPEPSVLATEPG